MDHDEYIGHDRRTNKADEGASISYHSLDASTKSVSVPPTNTLETPYFTMTMIMCAGHVSFGLMTVFWVLLQRIFCSEPESSTEQYDPHDGPHSPEFQNESDDLRNYEP